MRSELLLLVFVEAAALGCRRRRPSQYSRPVEIAAASVVPRADGAETAPVVDPDDLLPGQTTAFGLSLPLGTNVQLDAPGTKMLRVDAQMPRVLRYLQQRLDYHDADIQPLGAMIRNARVKDSSLGTVVDVGVRDEGDRTFLTVWNRTPPPVPAESRSAAESLQAAGIDPQSGQMIPQLNH